MKHVVRIMVGLGMIAILLSAIALLATIIFWAFQEITIAITVGILIVLGAAWLIGSEVVS